MSVFPEYKDIVKLVKQGMTVEAQEEIMKFREAQLALQEENMRLKGTIKELEAKLSEKEKINFEPPFYYKIEGDKKDGPFCQKCYDSDTKLIRLQDMKKGAWQCVACNNNFFEDSYKVSQWPTQSFGKPKRGY